MGKNETFKRLLVRKARTQQVQLFTPHCLQKNHDWPLASPWECGSWEFFVLVSEDFVIYTWSNGSCPTGLSGCSVLISGLVMCTWFHIGYYFGLPQQSIYSDICLCYQTLHKGLEPWDSRSHPWAETFHTCPFVSLPERKHILCGLRWRRALETCAWSLWTLKMHTFFPYAFALYPLLPKILLQTAIRSYK